MSMLLSLDWDCQVAADEDAAAALLESGYFDVLITDYHMPHDNAFHFICCLRREGIVLPAIVMSGNAGILQLTPKDLLNIPAVLSKPFGLSELAAALREACGP